jgi:hypothetical protein
MLLMPGVHYVMMVLRVERFVVSKPSTGLFFLLALDLVCMLLVSAKTYATPS